MEIDDQEMLTRSSTKHRALTPLRALRGLVCIVVLLSTAFVFIVYLAPFAVLLRCFSVRHSRRATSLVFGLWLGLWPFLFEKINETKVVFSGDNVPPKERALLIANHRTEVDWMYLWDLALRKDCLGSIKYVLKGSLMNLPVFGWGFHVLEFVPLQRKWDLDEPVLRRMVSSFSDPRDPLWLAIFPEGTDFCDEKREKSRKYAAENGLPVLSNVLLPKTKGFCACLEALRDSLDAVYDVTIAYKNRPPSFSDNLFGVDPSEVHIHVKRISIDEIPLSEAKAASWLVSAFERKDELLGDFDERGRFTDLVVEEELSLAKCSSQCALVIVSAAVLAYLTLCASAWFKLYVCLSCVYLVLATHLDIRPESLPGLFRTVFRLDREK